MFFQNVDAIIGPDDAIVYPEGLTKELDYELELAVIIGRSGKFFGPEEAEDYIEATPPQRAVIEQARDEVIKAFETRMKNKQTHAQIAGLLAQDKLDVDALNRIADQRADDVREIGHLVVAEVAKVHAVLTPEQRAKLLQRFKERHGDHGGFGGE